MATIRPVLGDLIEGRFGRTGLASPRGTPAGLHLKQSTPDRGIVTWLVIMAFYIMCSIMRRVKACRAAAKQMTAWLRLDSL
jgi:hypothetical protein